MQVAVSRGAVPPHLVNNEVTEAMLDHAKKFAVLGQERSNMDFCLGRGHFRVIPAGLALTSVRKRWNRKRPLSTSTNRHVAAVR